MILMKPTSSATIEGKPAPGLYVTLPSASIVRLELASAPPSLAPIVALLQTAAEQGLIKFHVTPDRLDVQITQHGFELAHLVLEHSAWVHFRKRVIDIGRYVNWTAKGRVKVDKSLITQLYDLFSKRELVNRIAARARSSRQG